MENKIIYLDNAATSFPKPEGVYDAVLKTMREECGNPGRSGHRLSLSAGRIVAEARMLCSRLFNAKSPDDIVLTYNTTVALNIAINGIAKPGDHIITSSLEHNSVARPLKNLEHYGVEVTKISTDINFGLRVEDIKNALQPNTRLVVCSHISNVTGTLTDIGSIGSFCRDNGIVFLVDAAQSAGCRVIDVQSMCVDMLAFPGHKGLFGPQGTGGLYIKQGIEIKSIIQGGTGSKSESLMQPETIPDKFESGTHNTPGLAGLAAGIRFIFETGIEKIYSWESKLTNSLIEGINSINGVKVVSSDIYSNNGSVVSVCFDKISPADAALMLDAAFNIGVRSGLHCSSDAHRSIGTLEKGGTVRISPNYFNTNEDIQTCLNALEHCAKGI